MYYFYRFYQSKSPTLMRDNFLFMFVAGTSHEHTDEEEFFSIEWYIDIRDITFFFFFLRGRYITNLIT